MMTRALLLELVTEELPPKALNALGEAFARGIHTTLHDLKLLAPDCKRTAYATPRRLAIHLSAVLDQAPDQLFSEKLMPVRIGLDGDGAATPALTKKLQARGLSHLEPKDLIQRSDGKQDMLYAEGTAPGAALADGLQQALDFALTHLPIPKVMQYQLQDGRTSVKFVRPAHHLLALWGEAVVPVKALGLTADRYTRGHRFMNADALSIDSADTWAQTLETRGHVIASFAARRDLIATQLARAAKDLSASIGAGSDVDALLDEVTALVEFPTVYVGTFDKEFLAVPPECLILTMRLNQKYFPLFQPDTGTLTHRFLIVSNMRPQDPSHIIHGNQRVVRPRLADAQFFYQADLRTPLAERVQALDRSVYHNKLGSELERTKRVQALARWLAPRLGADADAADRAAFLARADLNTQMVGEFPELQGIMGAYYAAHDGESTEVVQALRDQYRTRLEAPVTPATLVSAVLYMAERAETLVGIWGIGLVPSGERDPYGLRRAALGLISAYDQLARGGQLQVSQDTPASLSALLAQAAAEFTPGTLADGTVAAVLDFVYERDRNQLAATYPRHFVDAVLAQRPPLHQIPARIEACAAFAALPESEALSAANKRIANLLKKAEQPTDRFDATQLTEPAARQLADALARLAPQARSAFEAGDFTGSLTALAQIRADVDRFFTEVMVMDENAEARENRLALLRALHKTLNHVADLSRLTQ